MTAWIWIIRHGKAERLKSGQSDDDRPLAAAGAQQARWLGAQIARSQTPPACLVSSPALRALDTARLVYQHLCQAGLGTPWMVRPEVGTSASVGQVLALIGEVLGSADRGAVAVVGHNPTLSGLVAALLAGPTGGREVEELSTGEAALVQIQAGVTPGTGRLGGRWRLTTGD